MTDEKSEEREELIGMYEVLDALEGVIAATDPAKRETLARILDAYAEDFPEDFYWATGFQAPVLLHHLLTTIDIACRPEPQSKSRPAVRRPDKDKH